jgi:hypothetical protein
MLNVIYAECYKKPLCNTLNVVMLIIVMLNVVAPNYLCCIQIFEYYEKISRVFVSGIYNRHIHAFVYLEK